MREDQRQKLRQQFQFRCAYCGIRERDAGSELTVDHFQPRSKGGADGPENWIYSCHACNEFKGDYWRPDSPQRILHPLRDDLSAHWIEEPDGILRALTETGAFHIDRLRLNRSPLVEFRRQRRREQDIAAARSRLLEHLDDLFHRLEDIISTIKKMRNDEGND